MASSLIHITHDPMREIPIGLPRRSARLLNVASFPTITAQLSGLHAPAPKSAQSEPESPRCKPSWCSRGNVGSHDLVLGHLLGNARDQGLGQGDRDVNLARLEPRGNLASATYLM
jgi:hypothetical protein